MENIWPVVKQQSPGTKACTTVSDFRGKCVSLGIIAHQWPVVRKNRLYVTSQRFHILPLVHVPRVQRVLYPGHINRATTFPAGYIILTGRKQHNIGQKAHQGLFLHYFLSAAATKVLFAFGNKKAGETGGSGPIHVYKIPDGDCMWKHSSGAEHTAELLWIFGSSFCCHPVWRISSWQHDRKTDQKKVWRWQKVNTRKLVWTGQNWYEHRLGIRRQFLRSRGAMF